MKQDLTLDLLTWKTTELHLPPHLMVLQSSLERTFMVLFPCVPTPPGS